VRIIRICKRKLRTAAEKWGTKTHLAYLVTATVVEGPVLLRVTTGGCLIFCVIGEVLKDTEQEVS
jgi:hypothetical protein